MEKEEEVEEGGGGKRRKKNCKLIWFLPKPKYNGMD